MQSAFGFFQTCPASRAQILSRLDCSGAMRASDAWVTAIMEWVIGNVVLVDVVPDLLMGPVSDRVELHQAKLLIPFDLRRGRPHRGLLATDGGDPGPQRAELLAQGLDFAQRAALVGVAFP